MSKARPETATGHRKHTEATRAKLSAISKAAWERQSPEQKAAALARIGRGAAPPGGDPPPSIDGRRNPLAMTPRELWRALRG